MIESALFYTISLVTLSPQGQLTGVNKRVNVIIMNICGNDNVPRFPTSQRCGRHDKVDQTNILSSNTIVSASLAVKWL